MLSPIHNNHLLPATKLEGTFKKWGKMGPTTCKDFYIDVVFLSFTDLANTFNISKSSFLRYLQVRHFIQTQNLSFPQLPESSNLDVILQTSFTSKGHISNLYPLIMSLNSISTDNLKTKWEEELGVGISDLVGDRALCLVNGTCSCACLNLILFSVLHRWLL